MRVFAEIYALQMGLHDERLPLEAGLFAVAINKAVFERKVLDRCGLDQVFCDLKQPVRGSSRTRSASLCR